MENTVHGGFGGYIFPFVSKSRHYLAWWQALKFWLVDCFKDLLAFFIG
jgi:hypothetical protein